MIRIFPKKKTPQYTRHVCTHEFITSTIYYANILNTNIPRNRFNENPTQGKRGACLLQNIQNPIFLTMLFF